ncbi:hypothetical protein [Microbacterium sp. A84]|uniref:hypothetical protein n=1 Tax=Microbacterium sp. A84 TaxID=3450715 RepID=UPI003F43A9A2
MNRRERRASHRRARLDPRAVQYAQTYKCPDCDSIAGEVTRDQYGLHHATILHDSTCPRLNGITC